MNTIRLYVRDEPEANYGEVYTQIKEDSEFGIYGEVIFRSNEYSNIVQLDRNSIYYAFEYHDDGDNEYLLKNKIITNKEEQLEINCYSKQYGFAYVIKEIDCNISSEYIVSNTITR